MFSEHSSIIIIYLVFVKKLTSCNLKIPVIFLFGKWSTFNCYALYNFVDHNINEKEKMQNMDLVVKKEAWKEILKKVRLAEVENQILKEETRAELQNKKECLQKNK